MNQESFLVALLLGFVISTLVCRWWFYDYFRTNHLETNPEKTNRYIIISEVVNHHLIHSNLTSKDIKVLKRLRVWEISNLVAFPLIVITIVIVELMST